MFTKQKQNKKNEAVERVRLKRGLVLETNVGCLAYGLGKDIWPTKLWIIVGSSIEQSEAARVFGQFGPIKIDQVQRRNAKASI